MERLLSATLDHPRLAVAVLLATTLALAAGLPRLRSEYGYRPLLGGGHPAIVRMERFVDSYGGGFPLRIVYECGPGLPCREALDDAALAMARAVGDHLAGSSAIRRVESPAHAPLLVPAPGGFRVERLRSGEVTPALRSAARRDRFWRGSLVAEDPAVGAIVLQLVDTRSPTMEEAVDEVDAALAPFRERGFRFHLAGHPVESVVAGRELAESTAAMTPLSVAVVGGTVWLLTRSLVATAATLLTVGLGLVFTFGVLGWLGWPQDSVLQVLATVLLIVGVCDAVHLLARLRLELAATAGSRGRGSLDAALRRAGAAVAAPCLLTSATTAGAFASFATSDLATFARFGAISAFGVVACLLLTFTMLPLVIRAVGPGRGLRRPLRPGRGWPALQRAIAGAALRRAGTIAFASTVLLLVCFVLWIGWLRVDTDIEAMYGERSRVTRWIRFVESRFPGIDGLEVELSLPPFVEVEDPAAFRALARVEAVLEERPELGSPRSVRGLVSRLNRLLHGDDPRYEAPGHSVAANAELLELVAFEDPELLTPWVAPDRRRLRVSAEGASDSADGRAAFLEGVAARLAAVLPPGFRFDLTGPLVLERDWVGSIERTQLRSFGAAAAVLFVAGFLFYRSAVLAVLAALPALLAVVVTLGVMAAAGLALDVGRVMIAAVVLGIGVDDAIHLLFDYRRERQAGADAAVAMARSLERVGPALVVTSLALAAGFLTLLLSSWQTIASFGFLVSLAVLGALAGSLFLLPALCVLGHRQVSTDPSVITAERASPPGGGEHGGGGRDTQKRRGREVGRGASRRWGPRAAR